jgi:hypothetical protein
MKKHQFGGQLKLSGKAYNSKEAEEEAAFAALVFIEKHFGVKIVDFNYSECKKALKDLNLLIALVSKIIELAGDVKIMWWKLNNAIKAQLGLFRFDPHALLKGICYFPTQFHLKDIKLNYICQNMSIVPF